MIYDCCLLHFVIEDVVDARGEKGVIIIASSISAAVALLVCLSLVLIYTRKRNKHFRMRNKGMNNE